MIDREQLAKRRGVAGDFRSAMSDHKEFKALMRKLDEQSQ